MAADDGGRGPRDVAPVDHDVAHVRAAARDLGRIEDAALADLEEPPARRHHREARVDRFAGEGVEHHVDAATARRGHDPVAELERARIEHVGDALGSQELALRRAPRGRQHLGPALPRDLDRGQAHSAGPGVDQHAIAALHGADRGQRVGGRHVRHRQGRGLLGRERRRLRDHERGVDRHVRAETARRDGHHLRAHREALDARAHRDHRPRALAAERTRVAGIHGERVEHVLEVEAARPHADLDLSRARGASRRGATRQALEAAGRGRLDLEWGRFAGGLGPTRPPDEARGVTLVPSPGDLVLVTRARELREERRDRIDHGRGIEVHAHAGHLGMLQSDRAAEAPQRSLDRGGHPGVRGEAMRPARHQPEARAAIRDRQQRLDGVQAAGRQPERRASGDCRRRDPRGRRAPRGEPRRAGGPGRPDLAPAARAGCGRPAPDRR